MLPVRLSDGVIGKVLGNTVYDSSGRVLLQRGTRLTSGYIRRLRERGYMSVYVLNELAPDIVPGDVISADARARANTTVKTIARNLAEGRKIDVKQLQAVIDNVVRSLSRSADVVMDLSSLKTIDDYTFEHSVNVCVLSVILRRETVKKPRDLKLMGEGALLHDIGKLSTPLDILLKPGGLTQEEYEEVKKHSLAGYNILSRLFPDSPVSEVALGHHERYDGSGYPFGRGNEEIDAFSRIAAVADVYDAVTSDRVYRDKRRPHEAMILLEAAAGVQLDPQPVAMLVNRLAHYPVGTIVRLDNGEIGVVSAQDARSSRLPQVRVVVDPEGGVLTAPYEISLVDDSVSIADVLDDYPDGVLERMR